LSFGFLPSRAKATVAKYKDIIAGYGYYKQSFEQGVIILIDHSMIIVGLISVAEKVLQVI